MELDQEEVGKVMILHDDMPFSRMLAAKSGKVIELQRYIVINAI